MPSRFQKPYIYLRLAGLDPRAAVKTARNLGPFLSDYRELKRQMAEQGSDLPLAPPSPYLFDRHASGGLASGHYFHQDLLVARRIFERNPRRHIDVGSRVDGFVAHVATFRPIEVLDVRPTESDIPNISCTTADLSAALPTEMLACTDSLSSLHAIEHFGLGRYGDPIDVRGHERAIDNFHQMLEPGGTLYLSTPMGPDRLEFNEQRVFSPKHLLGLFGDRFSVDRFSYVGDDGKLREDVELTPERAADSFGCRFGCGIFELRKN